MYTRLEVSEALVFQLCNAGMGNMVIAIMIECLISKDARFKDKDLGGITRS